MNVLAHVKCERVDKVFIHFLFILCRVVCGVEDKQSKDQVSQVDLETFALFILCQ